MRKRLRAKLAEIKQELKRRRHQRIADQGQWLKKGFTYPGRSPGLPSDPA